MAMKDSSTGTHTYARRLKNVLDRAGEVWQNIGIIFTFKETL
jgi:hypothetical protein